MRIPLQVLLWTAYKRLSQIQMDKDDEEKTAFHTSQGVYANNECFGPKEMRCHLASDWSYPSQQQESLPCSKHSRSVQRRELKPLYLLAAEEAFTQSRAAYSSNFPR
ncbi:hypothetical protein Tco_0424078 [Tanacetum coccineum]